MNMILRGAQFVPQTKYDGQSNNYETDDEDFYSTPPPPFDVAQPAMWPHWKNQFISHLNDSDSSKKTEAHQIAMLHQLVGHETLQNFSETERLSDFLSQLDKYFNPDRNTVLERFHFHSRVQKEHETVESFVQYLKNQAALCDFGTQRESLLRDRIVIGVRDKKVSEGLKSRRELTLREAIEAALEAEQEKVGHRPRRSRRTAEKSENGEKQESDPLMDVKVEVVLEEEERDFVPEESIAQNQSKDSSVKCYIIGCGKSFATKTLYTEHLVLHRGEKRSFQCDVCSKIFNRSDNLATHLKIHTGEKPFKCDTCGRCFSCKASLVSHSQLHSGKKKPETFKCKICDEVFKKRGQLKTHSKTHRGEKAIFQCDNCSHRFLHEESYQSHVETCGSTHKKEKKTYQCEVCAKIFSRSDNLATHLRLHTGEKPYKCDSCDRCFSSKSYLINHSSVHSANRESQPKAFKCEVCGKLFAEKYFLKVHSVVHAVDRPQLPCDMCSRTFLHKASLKSHVLTVHTEIATTKPYKCDKCPSSFTSTANLTKHVKRRHLGLRPYVCEVCSRAFASSGDLKMHVRSHTNEKPFACELCGALFKRKNNLMLHLKWHRGEKPFSCDICDRSFVQKYDLARHLFKHTGEKPYQCHICPRSFSFNDDLSKHLRVHKKNAFKNLNSVTPS